MSRLLAEKVWPSYRKKRQSFTYFWQKAMGARIIADFACIKKYVAAVELLRKTCLSALEHRRNDIHDLLSQFS